MLLILAKILLSSSYFHKLSSLMMERYGMKFTENLITSYTGEGIERGETGKGIVPLYAAPNPFLLNKICLNQIIHTNKDI